MALQYAIMTENQWSDSILTVKCMTRSETLHCPMCRIFYILF